MKFRISPRFMPSYSNRNRIISSNTLHPSCRLSFLISCPHYTRCKLWLTSPNLTRKWRLLILYCSLFTRRARYLLQFLLIPRNLKSRCSPSPTNNSNSFCRLRPPMGTNKVLRSNCYHQSSISYSLYWKNSSRMNMRRVRSWQCNTQSLFRISLSSPICYRSFFCCPPSFSSPNRL